MNERNIKVEFLTGRTPVEERKVEMVERKGMGHPDSLCDGIAESVSRALCNEYRRKCGIMLHHNTDKVQIVAGRSNPKFGDGEVISPIYVLLGGRATMEFEGNEFAVKAVSIEAAREYLRNVRNLDVMRHVEIDCRLGTGSSDLRDVFMRSRAGGEQHDSGGVVDEIPNANDTSFGVSHAPLSDTERVVLHVENRVMDEFRFKEDAVGEDMKVMALRMGDKITLTVGNAFVSRYLESRTDYEEAKRRLSLFIEEVACENTERDVEVLVNRADTPKSAYITVTGTSAEMGDDGAAGRGNRCNGLITPSRPMSMEGVSGKNPVNHTGKLYNLLAMKIAEQIAEEVEGVKEVYVELLSEIGRRIDDPKVALIEILPETANTSNMESKARRIADEWLSNVMEITEMVLRGDIKTF
ncbi:MAG: methionine adenosyltransferase [Canidatus Methanoxibalbensis ujae]|nr:methionine adenosyltransferase [Candidatus Methanoxibalbensis ujae]RLG37179.1 MAG: methionine adenosyltransferase [Methanosarcinales archaeon]